MLQYGRGRGRNDGSSEDMSVYSSSPTSTSSSSEAMIISPRKKLNVGGTGGLPNNDDYYSISSSSSPSPSSSSFSPSSPSSSSCSDQDMMLPPTNKPTRLRSTTDDKSGERSKGRRGGRGRGGGGRGGGVKQPLKMERSSWKQTCLRCASGREHSFAHFNGVYQQGRSKAVGDLHCRPIASFFKLILEPRLDLERLVIPMKFMQMHGKDISNIIFLRIPTGKVWKFELVRQDSKALVRTGWPEFVEFYSLSHGSTMVFQYLGSSQFDVVIFDMSTSEIDYPIYMKKKDAQKANPQQKRPNAGRPPVWDPNSEVVKAAEAYKRAHSGDLSFMIVVTRGYIRHNLMNIPFQFAKSHMIGSDKRFITLQVSGSSWSVKMITYHHQCPNYKLTKGVNGFFKANNIQEGDAFVFELVANDTFKVTIFRTKYFGS